MIALGLVIEAVAAALVGVGLVLGGRGVGVLWVSVATALAGLVITSLGVRRARPSRRGWTPAPPVAGAEEMHR